MILINYLWLYFVARKTLHRSVGWALVRTFFLKITQVVLKQEAEGLETCILNINRILVFIVLTIILSVYWTQGIYSARVSKQYLFQTFCFSLNWSSGQGIFEREFIFLMKWFYCVGLNLSLCYLYIMQRWWHIMQGWMNSFYAGWIRRPQFFPPVTFFFLPASPIQSCTIKDD